MSSDDPGAVEPGAPPGRAGSAPADHQRSAQVGLGRSAYGDERGHPRLRMRHAPFAIGQPKRDAWLRHMLAAVEGSTAPSGAKILLRQYFDRASTAMINRRS
jgi:truncated hemoglobin YjbI